MNDLKVILYREHRPPRTLSVRPRLVYSTLILTSLGAILFVGLLAFSLRLYLNRSLSPMMDVASKTTEDTSATGEDQVKVLQDQVAALESKIKNQAAIQAAPKEIDKKNPALALFAPIVVDQSRTQKQVEARNFKFTPGAAKAPGVLSFELHNAVPDSGRTQKGYIVVLARQETLMKAYPNIFSTSGPYLLDFEKGETFQVQRFRMVNAQFELDGKAATNFQILIFTRDGELLINANHEVGAS